MMAEGFEVGDLCIKKKGHVQLTIGYHQLSGTVIRLKKPLLVLEKETRTSGEVNYDAIGVIREKVLFKEKPYALISKPGGGS